MKILTKALLVFAMFPLLAQATIRNAPFIPEIDQRFDVLERNLGQTQNFTNNLSVTQKPANPNPNGVNSFDASFLRSAHAVYNALATSPVSGSAQGAAGSYDLGVVIPANALLVRGYIYFKTQFTKSGAPTLALYCGNAGSNAGNLKAAADLSGNAAGSIISLKETGTATGASTDVVVGSTLNCDITAVVTGGNLTAGFADVYVDYLIHN